jgi:hypothetical protein
MGEKEMMDRTKIERVIGKTFADKLEELVIDSGKIQVSRRMMIDEVGCANFAAASRLNKLLNRLGVGTISQLFKLDPASLARTKGIGESSIFVAMCLLDCHDVDVLEWWSTDAKKFATVKRTVMKKSKKNKQAA